MKRPDAARNPDGSPERNPMAGNNRVQVRVQGANQKPLTVLLEDELVLGRECEGLLLADGQVSRRHIRFRRLPDQRVEVADLNSTNGSFIEGVQLTKPVVIETPTRVVIGDTMITVQFIGEDETPVPGRMGQTTIRALPDMHSTSIDLVADMVNSGHVDVEPRTLEGDTVTILFSDIESSTERATEMGDAAWFTMLEAHNRVIRTEMGRFGGREVKSIGDGFMLVFPSVRRALRFAGRVQQIIESESGPDLRVRMGLHTGEAIVDQRGDLFGRHINLAARVANLASGGQVLVSLVVREIAAGWNDALFGEPAEVELKGFTDSQIVYEVSWPHLDVQP